jgi:nucleotide-binding universal stress UspA family protein
MSRRILPLALEPPVPAAVLAALDPVAIDPAPVRFAAAVAAFTGAPLVVAAAYADDEAVDRLTGGQLGEDLAASAGAALERIVAELRREGVEADPLALGATSPPRALSVAAEHMGAALLVVGSAARAEPGRVTPGSTGERLVNGAPCAVAIVPLEWVHEPQFDVVGAGFVDTAEGRAAVHAGHALADRAGAVLRVLSAVQPRSWMLSSRGDRGATLEQVGSEIRLRAEEAAHAATAGLLGAPVDVDVAIAEPDALLLDASREIDVLVCGSRGYGPRPATLTGGVTRRVLADAACPVLVVPHGAEIPFEALLADDDGA